VPVGFNSVVYQVLIASPSDVEEERRVIPAIIHDWNAVHAKDYGIVLLPVMWETHCYPVLGGRPQEMINRQITENCDILVGVFWTRIGTHTGVAESGTIEEIDTFMRARKPVMLYFRSSPVDLDRVDLDQYQRLMDYRAACQRRGLTHQYASLDELRHRLNVDLTRAVRDHHQEMSPVADRYGRDLSAFESLGYIEGGFHSPKDQDAVRRAIECSGWVRPALRADHHLWLAVEIGDFMWPKEGEIIVAGDGTWEAVAFEGGNPPDGRFSLSLYATTSEAAVRIQQWINRGKMSDSYPGIRDLPGCRRIAGVNLRLRQ